MQNPNGIRIDNPFSNNPMYDATSSSASGESFLWPPSTLSPSLTYHDSSHVSTHPYVNIPSHSLDAYTNRATFDTESIASVDSFLREPWWHHAPVFQAQPLPPLERTMGDYLQPETTTGPSCITFPYNGGNFWFRNHMLSLLLLFCWDCAFKPMSLCIRHCNSYLYL